MSSSFHTLEEGMKITLYLMFLQEPFAFPTSCSLQPIRLWGGRSPLPPGAEAGLEARAAPLRGCAAIRGAPQPALSSLSKTQQEWGGAGRMRTGASSLLFPGETQVRGGSWEPPSLPLLLRMRGETGFPPAERSPRTQT